MALRPGMAAMRVVVSAADAVAAGRSVQARAKLAPIRQRANPPAG
jgi:hypothetical protein